MHTKVQHTRTIEVNKVTSGIPNRDTILVADCELILVDGLYPINCLHLGDGLWKHPIIISKTEKIEANDYYFANNTLFKADEKLHSGNDPNTVKNQFKVLVLPEQFLPTDIKKIAEGKLKEGKIAVECEKNTSDELYFSGVKEYHIKLNSQGHAMLHVLHEVKEKMYTKEEWFKLMDTYSDPRKAKTIVEKADLEETRIYFNSFKKWFEENVN